MTNNNSDEKTLERKIYIGKNGSGKTTLLNGLISTYSNENDKIVFDITSIDNPEEQSIKPSEAKFKKSYWHRLSEQIDKLTTFKHNLKIENILEDEKKKIANIFNEYNKNTNNIEIELYDEITKTIFNNANMKLNIEKNDFENIENTIEFTTLNKSLSDQLKNILKKIESSRGTGNYQYFVFKFIYSILTANFISDERQKDVYIIIDEPENYMHPSMRRNIAYKLLELSLKYNVIISTHSETIASIFMSNPNVEVFIPEKNENIDGIFKKINITNVARKYGESTRLSFVRNMFAEKIFIVEGNNDIEIVEEIIYDSIKEKTIKNFNYNIQTVEGKGKISDFANSLIDNYGIDKNSIFIVYDLDGSKISQGDEKHINWNKKIDDLMIGEKNIFYFNENLEVDLMIKKSDIEKHRLEKEGSFFTFEKFSSIEKFIELKNKIISFLEVEFETKNDIETNE